MTKILCLISIFFMLSACASTDGMADSRKMPGPKLATDQVTLLSFMATGKPGEKQFVYDGERDNKDGTVIIKHHYMAASGNHCRTYYWLASGGQGKANAHNLNVACQSAAGKWVKVRTLSNIEAFMEKEPVGYVLH